MTTTTMAKTDSGCGCNLETTAGAAPVSWKYFRLEVRENGVGIIWFSVPGKVNLLKLDAVYELEKVLDYLAKRHDLKGFVLASPSPENFIAGADITEINQLQETSEAEVYRMLERAKQILAKIPALGKPFVAAIDGPCKGGGLELALWCTHRLASTSTKTALALPEVRLGLLPGFGGAVILPRLVEPAEAVKIISSGIDVNAQEAWRLGLVDEAVAQALLLAKAEAVALGEETIDFVDSDAGRAYAAKAAKNKKPALSERFASGMLRVKGGGALKSKVATFAHNIPKSSIVATVKAMSRGYDAPAIAADCALRCLDMPFDKALAYESAVFAKRTQTNEARNLVDMFIDRSQAKKLAGEAAPYAVKCLGVVGSGIMGREIAFEALMAGSIEKVVLVDVKEELLTAATQHMAALTSERVKSGKMSEAEAAEALSKLQTATEYSALTSCDAIIEAIPEKLEWKHACYKRIDSEMEAAGRSEPYFIFSNTSALSLEALAQGVKFKDRFSGMHFFNPVSRMVGVEIPATTHTSKETLATSIALVNALGKLPLPCKDYPGFIVNAILGAELVVASHLLNMGVSVESIDKAMKNFGMPMGPIELMDYVGLDVVLSVARTLNSAHGERLALPEDNIVGKLVEQGALGRKSGKGFYIWQGEKVKKSALPPRGAMAKVLGKITGGGGKRLPVLNPALKEIAPALGSFPMCEEAIREVLVGAIEMEAVRVLEAGVVEEPFLLDLAFKVSTGFTMSLGGPLKHIDQRGVKAFADLMRDISIGSGKPGQNWRLNFAPSRLLEELARSRRNIYS